MNTNKDFYDKMKEKFPLVNVVGSGLSETESKAILKGKTPNKRGLNLGELIRDPMVIKQVESSITERTRNIYKAK